jgi:methyltransferase (TIGR00027 family)
MSLLSLLVFLFLQLVLFPLAIVGLVLVGYKQIVVSKRLGVSQTAIEVLNGRWTMHVFGMRDDEATVRLAAVLPNTSTAGLWFFLFPVWVKYKMTGKLFGYPRRVEPARANLGDLVPSRTLWFDHIIERVLGDVQQFVMLGAGYDTRAYGPLRAAGVRTFEVDQASVQTHKLAMLAAAGIDTTGVDFVQVDFSTDDLFEKLTQAGYDPSRKTLFLWEGVTLYLSEAEVRATMKQVRTHSPPGSVLVADLYAERMVKMGKGKVVSKTLEITGEGLGFSLGFESGHEAVLQEFVQSESLVVGETFFLGSNHKRGPFVAITELVVTAIDER